MIRALPLRFNIFFCIALFGVVDAVPLRAADDKTGDKDDVSASAKKETPAKKTFYDPVKTDLEGWVIKLDPRLRTAEHKQLGDDALKALANHLQRIKYIVPVDRVKQLQKLPIWLELDNKVLGNMQYHPGKRWLVEHGHDPRLVKHVHIPHAKALLARGTWAKHPYVILHELAHAYHDQVLSFENKRVLESFRQANEKQLYREVLLFTGRKVRHYALTNHKEYFAELTESYFGVNDFYPFVRAELQEYDPQSYLMLQEIWGRIR